MVLGDHFLSLLIRWIHVASMTFLVGGATLLWGLSAKSKTLERQEGERLLLFVAERYEWFFWLALGLLVMTGVGNLGAFGEALPEPSTVWGGRFIVKLSAVLIFMVFSLLRTLLITRLYAAGIGTMAVSLSKVFQGIYATTALFSAVVLVLAVSLAHG